MERTMEPERLFEDTEPEMTNKSETVNRSGRSVGLRTKLTSILLIFGLLPALTLFGILYHEEASIKKELTAKVASTAVALNDVIDRNLFERYGDVQAFALNSAAKAAAAQGQQGKDNPLVDAMNGYMTGYGIYKLMLLLSPDGRVLSVNSVDADGNALATDGLYGRSFRDAAWFADAMDGRFLEGKNGLTGTAVGQPRREKLITDIYGGDGYIIPFSTPVKNGAGQIVAVWVNFADFGLVEEIVSTFYRSLAQENMTRAELTILDPEGRIIVDYDPSARGFKDIKGYKRDFNTIGKFNLAGAGVEAAQRAVKGEKGAIVSTHARKKEVQAAGFARSTGAYDYPGLGWSALIRIPEEQAFALWNTLILTMLTALVISAGIIAVLGLFMGNRAVRPIRTLTERMLQLASGDKSVDLPLVTRGDEIGEMARTVQVFKDSMIEAERLQEEQRIAEQRALEEERQREAEKQAAERAEIERKEKDVADQQARTDRIETIIGEFDRQITTIVETLSSAATEMQSSAESMSAMADQTNRQATAVAAASEEATANVQTVASATEELSSSIGEISRQVAQSNQISQNAVDEARQTNDHVEGLASAAQKIGEVVDLINDIASQTNLLALNATIEAARAGEAGKGFAVVASEVKSLATQTGKATEEIAAQIAAIQGATDDAVSAIKNIGGTIGQIGEIATSVASAVEEQGAATREIATNVQQAAQGTQEVSGNIADVTRAAGESQAASGQILNAANELAQQGEVLRNEVNKFLSSIRAA